MAVRPAVWCLLAAATLARAAPTVPADLAPPGTRVLIGLSLGSLRESPLLKEFLRGHGKTVVTASAAMTPAGIGPLRDIDTIILASTGADQTASGVAIVRGRFAGARGEGAQLYHGVPVFRDPANPMGCVAILDGETALMGPEAELRKAIDRRGQASALDPELVSRFERLGAENDFWAVGKLNPADKTAPIPGIAGFDSIDRFEFAAALRDGLHIHGEAHLRAAAEAARLEAALKTISSALPADVSDGSRVEWRAENGTLALDVSVSEAQLRKAFEKMKQQMMQMILSGFSAGKAGGPARVLQPAAPAPRPQATIVTNDQGETVRLVLPGKR